MKKLFSVGLAASVEYEFRVIPAWAKSSNAPWAAYTPKGHRTNTNLNDLIPLAPEHVEAGRVSPTNINLTWIDNNENTRFYMICMVESGKQVDCDDKDLLIRYSTFFYPVSDFSFFVCSASNSLLITDLQPNSSYDFKVRAHNFGDHVGPFSQSTTIRTPADGMYLRCSRG